MPSDLCLSVTAQASKEDFQALGFYEKHGCRVGGALDDLPPGFTNYFLRKDLA